MPDAGPWALFAWEGMQCEVPPGWELGAAEGTGRKGYCRLDDGESTRLEIRWERGRARGDAGDVAARYLEALSKKYKRSDPPFEVRRDTRLVRLPTWMSRHSPGTPVLTPWDWRRMRKVRAHHPRLRAGPGGGGLGQTARRVLGSLRIMAATASSLVAARFPLRCPGAV